jgi:hypothetical protein
MRKIILPPAAALSLVLAHPAAAAELVDASEPETLVAIIQELGYRAKLETDGLGDPLIVSSVGGTEFSIQFYGCNELTHAACKLLLFKVGYDLDEGTTHAVINEWNATKLVGRAYLDDESDPWFEMPVNMDGGISRPNFEDTFDWWEVSIEGFEDHIGF